MSPEDKAEIVRQVSATVVWPVLIGQGALFMMILAKAILVTWVQMRATRRIWMEVHANAAEAALRHRQATASADSVLKEVKAQAGGLKEEVPRTTAEATAAAVADVIQAGGTLPAHHPPTP